MFVFPSCNVDAVTIVDVTDKTAPELISSTTYPKVRYTHQGWLTEDHNTFIFGDEFDEDDYFLETRSFVLDVGTSLRNPVYVGAKNLGYRSSDHNLYIKGKHVYEANYLAGLMVLEIGENIAAEPDLTEVAYIDIFPESDSPGYVGAWSVYPYFPSGNIVVGSTDRGLFVLKVTDDGPPRGGECEQEESRSLFSFGTKC